MGEARPMGESPIGEPPIAGELAERADQAARDRAVSDLTSTLFVEAGAGTGKTTVLVARYLSLVRSGDRVDGIAAITFTEAAAAELRARIRLELTREAAASTDLVELAQLGAAIDGLDAAPITTVHGFALRILGAYPVEAGLPPRVEVVDEYLEATETDEQWAAFLDRLLDEPHLTDLLTDALALGLPLSRLRGLADELHASYHRLPHAESIPWPTAPVGVVEIRLGRLVEAITDALGLRRLALSDDDTLARKLDTLAEQWEAVMRADDRHDLLGALDVVVGSLRPGNAGRKDLWPGDTKGAVLAALQRAHDELTDILGRVRSQVLELLAGLLGGFVAERVGRRRATGRLLFHDLLVFTRDLLRAHPDVRAECRASYPRVLIDEFQDTDPLQLEIAVLLASSHADAGRRSWAECGLLPADAGRLFFVGDPKQSIYRFRGADIATYLRARERLATDVVHLTDNFRSVPSVVDVANAVFGELMAAESPSQPAYVPLGAAVPATGFGPAVHVVGAATEGRAAEVRAREAADLVATIGIARAEHWPVRDRGTATRAARYDDIAILLPNRIPLAEIEFSLESAHIPYRIESQSLVWATPELRDALAVLQAVVDPADDIAVVGSLRTPALACSDRDLATWAATDRGWDYASAHLAELLDEPGDDAVASGLAELRRLHRRRHWLPVASIVEEALRELGFYEVVLAHRRPRDRWRRLDFLLAEARRFEAEGGRSLGEFVTWARRQADQDVRVNETVVPDRDDDAVRLLTIHAAKGLEYPIVLVGGLSVASRSDAPMVLWDEAGPHLKLGPFVSPFYETAKGSSKVFGRDERYRLLYVALTRARDHLVLGLHHKTTGPCDGRLLTDCLKPHGALLDAIDLAERAPTPTVVVPAPPTPPVEPVGADLDVAAFERWTAGRQRLLSRAAAAPVLAATSIARLAVPAPLDQPAGPEERADDPPPWRRGRAGTSIGRAVHAVLQVVDLASGAHLRELAIAQAAAEGLPGEARTVERLARSVLDAPLVRWAADGRRVWREVFVATPIEAAAIEGFIDLLVEDDDGSLVVVDYKTDQARNEADVDAAVGRYRLQGATYAVALEARLGRPVRRCVFVFARPSGAVERDVDDLDEAKRAVRDLVGRVHPASSTGSAP